MRQTVKVSLHTVYIAHSLYRQFVNFSHDLLNSPITAFLKIRQIKVLPDLNANGQLTLGENLADHGGLQVSFTALQNATKGQPSKRISGYTPEQRFFLAFAGVWAGTIRDAEIRKRVKSDPHSLAKWRVDGQLPHIDAWYKAFNITPKDPLYVPKDKRVTIW